MIYENKMNKFFRFFATGFGVGFSPVAPGTCGTLVGCLLFWFLSSLPPAIYTVTIVGLLFFAIWVSHQARSSFGAEDPKQIVIDEMIGMLITLAFFPFHWGTLLIGFVLFRIFDIAKPWPVCWADQKLPGGFGIVMDDVAAGLYAQLALRLLQSFHFLPT